MNLLCAVCLMTEDDEPAEADTIVNGTATCADHIDLIQDVVLSTAVHAISAQARRERARQ